MTRTMGRRAAAMLVSVAWLGLAGAGASSAQTPAMIPEIFVGEWNSELARCGDIESGTRMMVARDAIWWFESGARLVSVEEMDPLSIRVVMDLEDFEGVRRLTQRMAVTPDGTSMSVVHGERREDRTVEFTYRCPPVKEAQDD